MISLIQDFEADFLWKVSLKILNSGIILKTFTHALVSRVNPDLLVPEGSYLISLGKQCRPRPDCSHEQSGLCQHCLILSNRLITSQMIVQIKFKVLVKFGTLH